mmetsp:Transcript_33236/g.72529  ORF Transcript_33236/g.72529 Transcript_33236/m.72529 type:complete len:847 (-) Transcript_33236:30-2570(-)
MHAGLGALEDRSVRRTGGADLGTKGSKPSGGFVSPGIFAVEWALQASAGEPRGSSRSSRSSRPVALLTENSPEKSPEKAPKRASPAVASSSSSSSSDSPSSNSRYSRPEKAKSKPTAPRRSQRTNVRASRAGQKPKEERRKVHSTVQRKVPQRRSDRTSKRGDARQKQEKRRGREQQDTAKTFWGETSSEGGDDGAAKAVDSGKLSESVQEEVAGSSKTDSGANSKRESTASKQKPRDISEPEPASEPASEGAAAAAKASRASTGSDQKPADIPESAEDNWHAGSWNEGAWQDGSWKQSDWDQWSKDRDSSKWWQDDATWDSWKASSHWKEERWEDSKWTSAQKEGWWRGWQDSRWQESRAAPTTPSRRWSGRGGERRDKRRRVQQSLPPPPLPPSLIEQSPWLAPPLEQVPLRRAGPVRVLACGELGGRFDLLRIALEELILQGEAVDLVLAVGTFLSDHDSLLDDKLRCSLPVPVYFLQDLRKAPSRRPSVHGTTCLGACGVKTIAGLRVAFLSGAYNEEQFQSVWGCGTHVGHMYTMNAVEEIQHQAKQEGDSVDVLLTYEWPDEGWSGDAQSKRPSKGMSRSPAVSQLLSTLRPQYHICLGGDRCFLAENSFGLESSGSPTTSLALAKAREDAIPQLQSWCCPLQLLPRSEGGTRLKQSFQFEGCTPKSSGVLGARVQSSSLERVRAPVLDPAANIPMASTMPMPAMLQPVPQPVPQRMLVPARAPVSSPIPPPALLLAPATAPAAAPAAAPVAAPFAAPFAASVAAPVAAPAAARKAESLGPKLKEGWQARKSKTHGRLYYVEKATGKTSWEPPLAEEPPEQPQAGEAMQEGDQEEDDVSI